MNNLIIALHKWWKLHDYYIESYLELVKKYDVKVYIFIDNYEENNIAKYKNILFYKYNNFEDLENQILEISKKNNILFLNTFSESFVLFINQLRKKIWQKVTENFELFRNKKTQRELLLDYDKTMTIDFLETKIWKLNFSELKERFSIPFILKPKDGFESSGVVKIENEKDLENYKKNNILDNTILVEEFIDGKMYNIVYYVDEKWNIYMTNPIREVVAIEYGVDDFFSPVRIVSKDSLDYALSYDLQNFIKNTVKACNIKNTFVHQEFKITTKNQIKNIELNGRIWWYRLEMYKNAYNINLLELILNPKNYYAEKIKNNLAFFAIYPAKNWKLISYNYNLIEKIKKLDSFYSLRILPEKYEWKKVWLTKYGFKKLWWIKLKNSNFKQFNKDYNFVKENYFNLLNME